MRAIEPRFPEDVLISDSAKVPPRDVLNDDGAWQLFRKMVLIRQLEDTVQQLYNQGQVRGTTHIYSGQEAVAVGVCSALTSLDVVAATYRGHGHAIALGTSPQALLDELLGRSTGVCGGRAGSMNIVDMAHGLIGCFGIVGGSIAAATGAALSMKGQGSIAVAFFGDGAVNQAYFSECLNFAQVNGLPLLLICENNLYGEFTPWEQVTAGQICDRPSALGIPTVRIDGNDLWAVRSVSEREVSRVREEQRPIFIEALTYRFGGHSRSDPARYRPPGELEAWRIRDPLLIARRRLIDEYGGSDELIGELMETVHAEVDALVTSGLQAPTPAIDLSADLEFKE